MRPLTSITAFLILLVTNFSCTSDTRTKDNEIEVLETQLPPIKSNYSISWPDSNKAQLSSLQSTYAGNIIKYDSAILIIYMGYLLESSEKTYLPLNEKGQWISTIIKRKTATMKELYSIDSLLGDPSTYDNSINSSFFPHWGIIYFQNGKVIGQTAIGSGPGSIKSTIKLGNLKYIGALTTESARKIDNFFHKSFQSFYTNS